MVGHPRDLDFRASEIEVAEMLPDPEHLLWKEPDGRHSFELRTLIVPRS